MSSKVPLRDVNHLINKWLRDEEKVRKAVEMQDFLATRKDVEVCGICFDPFDGSKKMNAVSCGHLYCGGCWKAYIASSTTGQKCLLLRCPYPYCKAVVDRITIDLFASDQDKKKYAHFLVHSYKNRKIKWCPAPDCVYAVQFTLGTQNYEVCCKNGHRFCWNCREEVHSPVDCDTFRKWTMEKSDESKNWILVNSKPCPNCKTAIEKIDGCMHMICLPPCEYHFCWMCLGPWSDHPSRHGGFYACNIHTEQENMGLYEEHERNVRMAKSSLERYPKYYKQWQAKHSFLARNAITLHSRYAEYVKICFNNHYIFDKAFSEVMEEFCNNAKNAMGKSLVIFCSKLLEKDGSEKLIDGNIEKTLEKAVHLLSFFRNKDFYAKFYRQTLARRLLFGLSANEEHEIFILTKLKKHFGWHFTCRMERMILDRSLSKELQKAYDKYLSGNPPADPGINLTVNVLTKGIWPVFPAYDLRLPTELVKCAEVYTQHYNSTMTRRKISWMNSLGTCTIRVNWEGETRELVVTACQASLLWLFNNNERLNYSEIAAGLNFKGDVISLLYSLIHEDFNILKKIPPSDFISSTDSFEFNGHFSDKRENMMITFRGIERGNNAQDWSDTIDACIMRVMKQAQILESDELMMICAAELSRMLKLNSRTFGIQMANLIHQGFLERDGDKIQYTYICY